MCCAEFIAKYALFIANLAFSLLGIAIFAIGIVVLVAVRDLQDILPINIIPISLIILGVVVFFIGFLACCGAIRESKCMLICYSVIVGILAAVVIYITVVVFGHFDTIEDEVHRWIGNAFDNNELRPVFNVMELSFRCCGTTGAASYIAMNQTIPVTCCPNPDADLLCLAEDAFRGCSDMVGGWVSTFTGAIGFLLIVVIIVQLVAVVLALFLTHSIYNKRRRNVY